MNKIIAIATLGFALVLVTTGCQPEPTRNSTKFGRTSFGNPQQQPRLGNTQTAYIVNPGGDGEMSRVAQLFAGPALMNQPEWQLGNVSAQTGVRFWGEVYLLGGGGQGSVDKDRSRIHIEVADSRVGSSDGAGGQLQPFVLHIGYDNAGYQAADGGVSGGQTAVRFDQDGFGSVLFTGTINGNQFSGQLMFSNTTTDGAWETMGTFNVSTCNFFVCQ